MLNHIILCKEGFEDCNCRCILICLCIIFTYTADANILYWPIPSRSKTKSEMRGIDYGSNPKYRKVYSTMFESMHSQTVVDDRRQAYVQVLADMISFNYEKYISPQQLLIIETIPPNWENSPAISFDKSMLHCRLWYDTP